MKQKRISLLYLLLSFFHIIFSLQSLYSQNYSKIDSLKIVLKSEAPLNGTDADVSRLRTYINIGDLFEYHIPDSAIYWYEKASDTVFTQEQIKLHPKRSAISALSYRFIGNVYADMGEYNKSQLYYENSLRISEVLADKTGVSNCQICLGIIHKNKGEFPKAIHNYEKALIIKEELGDKRGISMCLNNLGIVYRSLGDYRKAANYYERSLIIDEELGDKRGISTTLVNLGTVYYFLRDYAKTIDTYEKSLKIAEELGDQQRISANLMGLGNVYLNQNEYAKSENYYNKSLLLAQKLGDKRGIAGCLYNLGNVNHDLGVRKTSTQIERDSLLMLASDYYIRSINIKEELGVLAELASDYPSLARNYLMLQKPDEAKPLLVKSLEITISLLRDNFAILSEKEKEMYLNKTKQIFNELHYYNLNFSKQNDSISKVCYNNELILKGLLLKSTRAMLDAVHKSNDTLLINSYVKLKQIRNRITALEGLPQEDRERDLTILEKEANELERTLVKLSSEFADLQNLFNYKWEDVQKELKPNEAAIEFISIRQGSKNDTIVYAALIITSESKQPHTIRLFEETELQKIIGGITDNNISLINNIYGSNQNFNNELYNLIWRPLEKYLTGIKKVYFAPVGVLNKISFLALAKNNSTLISDEYNLQQLSSTGKLLSTSSFSLGKNILAGMFGGICYNSDEIEKEFWKYLPGTLSEITIIDKKLTKRKIKTSLYAGKNATEENFKNLYSADGLNPNILHVATHGFFYPDPDKVRAEERASKTIIQGDVEFRGSSGFGLWQFVQNKNPMMRSGLVFAGANRVWSEEIGQNEDEGVLTAQEIAQLNMQNTQLVVLSACETGLGDILGSEGVYGLQRAFKMAGAKYLIMSLWQVPDKETVEFMELFYSKLLNNKDIRKAFSETQREMRQKYDPFYWAAFVLIE